MKKQLQDISRRIANVEKMVDVIKANDQKIANETIRKAMEDAVLTAAPKAVQQVVQNILTTETNKAVKGITHDIVEKAASRAIQELLWQQLTCDICFSGEDCCQC